MYFSRVVRISSCALIIAAFATFATAQASIVDPTFVPVPSVPITSNDLAGKGTLVQPDGKIVIWGGNLVVDGLARRQVARLNPDGSLDPTFTYCGCLLDSLQNALVQADGKVIIAGVYFGQAKVARLNTDGSVDPSFTTTLAGASASFAELITTQPDGKLLLSVHQYFTSGFHARYVTRLQTDGTADPEFMNLTYDSGRLINTYLRSLALDPSGKMYMAFTTFSGPSQSSILRRYNSNGTTDNTWEQPTFSPSFGAYFSAIAVQADGSAIVSGRFDTVNGLAKVDIVRLAPAGNVDIDFTAPQLGSGAGAIKILQSGKLLVSYNTTGIGLLVRLNTNGSLDNTFALSQAVSAVAGPIALDVGERIYFLGLSNIQTYRYFRLNPDGDEDTSFLPNVGLFGKVGVIARQPDGKLVVAGNFSQISGVRRPSIARLNVDGTVDTSFVSESGFSAVPLRLAVQSDGKIIAVGFFSTYNGVARQAIARLNADGSLDEGFAPALPPSETIGAVSVQSDGKVLIGGSFTTVNGSARAGIARLNPDGSLDNSFNAVFGSPQLTEVFQQADGRIMVGGGFSGVNGFNRSGMVRLNNDGSLDQAFNSSGISVARIHLQPDGKYLYNSIGTVGRRNSDGTADPTFAVTVFESSDSNGRSVDSVILQADGTVIVGGRFDKVGTVTRRNLVRLTSTGAIDALFAPVGTDAPVRDMVRQADGKIVVVGEYTSIETVTRAAIARVTIPTFRVATPFDFDGDGRAEFAVYRPSTGIWYQLFSGGAPYGSPTFGITGDVPVPADFDGDGRTDLAIFRPSNGQWWYTASATGQLRAATIGSNGDIPMPSDKNGDGTDDFVVFRPSNNNWIWYTTTGVFGQMQFGLAGDKPLIGDFDGDGKGDAAVFRPSTGDWWYAASASGNAHRSTHWGQTGDIPAPADFDGDGKTDLAVFRPSNGGWYVLNSSDLSYDIIGFGLNGDRPVAADYDGDGKADIAVFRPSTGVWYVLQSSSGTTGVQWGVAADVAIPNAFVSN